MLLAIDVGNTNITLGLYAGDQPGPRWRVATRQDRTPDEYGFLIFDLLSHAGLEPASVGAIAMASVVPPLTSTFREACCQYLKRSPLVVDSSTKTGIRVRYDDPAQLGADRVVDAVAGHKLYGGPACVIDFGTATTFDAVSADGDFLGGAIVPGVAIAADALFQRTAKLPRVDLQRPTSPIGRNTVHSLQSGLLFGYVGLVEGMVRRFRAEVGSGMKVIGTGGLAALIARETDVIDVLAPWLTLDGLKIIYELNQGTPS